MEEVGRRPPSTTESLMSMIQSTAAVRGQEPMTEHPHTDDSFHAGSLLLHPAENARAPQTAKSAIV